MRAVKVWRGTDEQSTTNFTWKVILQWATASAYTSFPGPQADEGMCIETTCSIVQTDRIATLIF